MEISPFIDVFPIGKGGFPASYVSLLEGISCWTWGDIPASCNSSVAYRPPGEEFQDKGTNGTMSSSKLGTFFRDSQVRNIVTLSQYEGCL